MWFIFASIQIFSLIHRFHLSSTPTSILSGSYFNTPAVLFNRSDSVAVLWLAETLARINKRKQSLKKRKSQAKLNACTEDFSFKKFVYNQGLLLCANHSFPNKLVNHTRKLFWHSNVNEPQRKNFVLIIIELSEVEIQQSSELFELL